MIKPMIHLNGTGRARLVKQYTTATDALREALTALSGTAPNGRDYYPLGDAAMALADHEHRERMEWLRRILLEVEALRDHCTDA